MHRDSTYTTKDFNESALLLANGFRLLSVHRTEACYFSFENSDRAVVLVEAFWRGDLTSNLREFVDAQRRIKDLIHKGTLAGTES